MDRPIRYYTASPFFFFFFHSLLLFQYNTSTLFFFQHWSLCRPNHNELDDDHSNRIYGIVSIQRERGVLPCGMTFLWRPGSQPPGTLSSRNLFRVASLARGATGRWRTPRDPPQRGNARQSRVPNDRNERTNERVRGFFGSGERVPASRTHNRRQTKTIQRKQQDKHIIIEREAPTLSIPCRCAPNHMSMETLLDRPLDDDDKVRSEPNAAADNDDDDDTDDVRTVRSSTTSCSATTVQRSNVSYQKRAVATTTTSDQKSR